MAGRRSAYSEALAERICGRIARGDTLAAVCRTEGMPPRPTARRWLTHKRDFRERYAQARLQARTRHPGGWTDRQEALAGAVCAAIAAGESLDRVCRRSGMPSRITLYRWLAEHARFRQRYAWARELQADALAEEMVGIADTATDFERARLQISARKQAAARLAPVKYKAPFGREPAAAPNLADFLDQLAAQSDA